MIVTQLLLKHQNKTTELMQGANCIDQIEICIRKHSVCLYLDVHYLDLFKYYLHADKQ